VASDGFHVNPGDFSDYFDPLAPHEFQSRLDFTDMMIQHRRADSVYRSGLLLPRPGPPVGLQVVDYDDDYVTLTWNRCQNPSVVGYYLNVRDTVYGDIWRRAHIQPVTDTVFTFTVSNPSHEHFFAVTMIDTLGRQSDYSFELPFISAKPHPPRDLAVSLDSLTPILSWLPYSDTSLDVYMIYRSIWRESFQLYDSVSALEYRDYEAESGIRYNYKISAKNGLQLESDAIGPVSTMPMALNKGVLFYDMNYDYAVHVDPYHRRYVDRLVYAVKPLLSMDYHDIEDSILPFKKMSHYSTVIFDSEKRGGQIQLTFVDSIRNYLSSGGKALFIIPNVSTGGVGVMKPHTNIFGGGALFYDYLLLDSSVTNAFVLIDDSIRGDLMGCQSLTPEYPTLTADMDKIGQAPLPIGGYIPLSGFLYPHDSVEYIYSYQSMYPDSLFQDQINGIKYIGDSFSFIILNFPLSLMEAPGNVIAFRQALIDLGVDLACGDIDQNQYLNIGDIVTLLAYLFHDGPVPPDLDHADVNCDGVVDLGDAQVIINAVFHDGAKLNCCP
jgi:hypothetical protein